MPAVARIESLERQPLAPWIDEAAGEPLASLTPLPEFASLGSILAPVASDDILVGALGDARLRVLSPLHVKFTLENEDFIAEAVEFDEFGFGDSRSAALRDLQRTIVELYFTLQSEQEALGPDLRNVWSRLQEKIQAQ